MREKITIDELRSMFGDDLPIEAVMLLFPKEPHGLSTDEIRVMLRKMAEPTSVEDLAIVNHPSHCCRSCGAEVGYLGRFFAWLFGSGFHGCTGSQEKGDENQTSI